MTIHASQRDAFAFLAGMADASVDCVVTDYPYPTLERHRARGTTVRLSAKEGADEAGWFGTLTIPQLADVTAELYRVLKKDSYAFIFVDADTEMLLGASLDVPRALQVLVNENKSSRAPTTTLPIGLNPNPKKRAGEFGWWPTLTWVKIKDTPCLWCEQHPGQPRTEECACDDPMDWISDDELSPGMGWHGRKCTEKILVLEKGRRTLKPFNNVFCAPRYPIRPPGTTIRATTPKPPSIVRTLVEAATDPASRENPAGSTVLDPFIGSGTIAEGIVSAGRNAIVNDVSLALFRDWMTNHFRRPFTEF